MSPHKIFYFILVSVIYSEVLQHSIVDNSLEDQQIKIEVLVNEKSSNIKRVTLHYKSKDQINYFQTAMIDNGNNFFYGIIPSHHVTTNGIEYYILLELYDNRIYSFPYINPILNPLSIKIKNDNKNKNNKSKFKNDGIQILSPTPNSRVFREDLLISLSYFKLKNIDNSKTKVFLNNRDITNKVKFYDNYLIYKPEFILDGRYNIDIIFFDKYNRELPKFGWSFTVLSKDKLQGLSTLLSHSGKINNHYSFNDTDSEDLEINNLNIDYRLNFDFLKIRNKFKIASNSNEFEQDKNRYLISVTAPYVNLQLGDSYPYINQYALNGYRVRGLNLKVDSKFFDAHIIQGELARPVVGNPNDNSIIICNMYNNMICLDSNDQPTGDLNEESCCIDECGEENQNQWVQEDDNYIVDFSRYNYTFKRNIYAFNLGFGHPEYLFLNMNILKTNDNTNTLAKISRSMPGHILEIPDDLVDDLINSTNYNFFNINIDGCDTTYSIPYNDLISNWNSWYDNYNYNLLLDNWSGDKPQDNLVLGSDLKISLDSENIIINMGSSFSLLNQNTWDPVISIEDLDVLLDDEEDNMIMEEINLPSNINFSDYEDIFKFSINQVPILPINLFTDDTLFEKIITMPSLAYNLDFNFRYFSHNFNIGIKQIGPEYNSLANPYLQKDIREQYISDKFRILNNRLFINYGFKRIEDGIEIDKKSLSKTDKYNIAFNYYPGYNLPTYSFSLKLINRDNGIDSLDVFTYQEFDEVSEEYLVVSDTTNRRESTTSFQTNFSISYDYENHNVLVNIAQSNKKDLLYETNIGFDSSYFSPRSLNQTFMINVKSKWSKILTSNINYNYNYYDYGNNFYYQSQVLRQIDLKGYYYRLKKLNTIQMGVTFGWAEGYSRYYQINPNVSLRLEIIKSLFFDFSYQYRYKKMIDDTIYNSSFLFVKGSYNF